MIVSASRRTDIPAFYGEWFMNRIEAGFCTVLNPFNPKQESHVSLRPGDVDVIVFWTRNPAPLFAHLRQLDDRGYDYYFLYTLLAYPRQLEPNGIPEEESVETFRRLAGMIGPDRVIWRYDPIVLSSLTDAGFHRRTFARLASALRDSTSRCIISLADAYKHTEARLCPLKESGVKFQRYTKTALSRLLPPMVEAANGNGMTVSGCAEEADLSVNGIRPGKCIDDEYIRAVFGRDVSHRKDPGQRPACRCVESRDIGAYDTCWRGCLYCYATRSPARVEQNRRRHDPCATALLSL